MYYSIPYLIKTGNNKGYQYNSNQNDATVLSDPVTIHNHSGTTDPSIGQIPAGMYSSLIPPSS